MRPSITLVVAAVAALATATFSHVVLAQTASAQAPSGCAPEGGRMTICGQPHPEDLIQLPGTPWVVESSVSGAGLWLINASTRVAVVLYPAPAAKERWDKRTYGKCPGPPDVEEKAHFVTVGLDVRPGKNGVDTVYAVNFGKGTTTSIQIFQIDTRDTAPSATWVGCVVAPNGVNLNGVAPLPHGGFAVTNFNPIQKPSDWQSSLAKVEAGEVNGQSWQWYPVRGWAILPRTEASGANAMAVSQNGHWLYASAWGSKRFMRVSLGRKPVERDEIPVGFRLDNVHWTPQGLLIGAGQSATGTRVVLINPETLELTRLIHIPDSKTFRFGTGAIRVGDEIWVCSAFSDRIVIFPAPK